jgi:hypothetical protein
MKLRSQIPALSWILPCVLAIATSALAQNDKPPLHLDGTWKWSFTMPDGSKVEPRVQLKQEGARLTGTAQFRAGTAVEIRNGIIQGDQVSFQVVRERDGQTTTTTYRGRLTGDTIKGTLESDWTGEKKSYPWEAQHASADATGTWQWTMDYGMWKAQMTLKLKQQGDKLTGKIKADNRRETDIKDGKFKKGKVSFSVERDRDGLKTVTQYAGTIDGDTIKGTLESDFGLGLRSFDWAAKRVNDEKEGSEDQ